jgi:hypothetical protein
MSIYEFQIAFQYLIESLFYKSIKNLVYLCFFKMRYTTEKFKNLSKKEFTKAAEKYD